MTDQVAPRRIQRRRAKGWKMPEGAVYVGRPTVLGISFRAPDLELAARMFRCWLTGSVRSPSLLECRQVMSGRQLKSARQEMLRALPTLRGSDLACWCRTDRACHADVLLEIANAG